LSVEWDVVLAKLLDVQMDLGIMYCCMASLSNIGETTVLGEVNETAPTVAHKHNFPEYMFYISNSRLINIRM